MDETEQDGSETPGAPETADTTLSGPSRSEPGRRERGGGASGAVEGEDEGEAEGDPGGSGVPKRASTAGIENGLIGAPSC